MQTITTNQEALAKRISSEVARAFNECQMAANEGKKHIFFTTDKDIQREVRDKLKEEHKIYVPTLFSRYGPSRPSVEHWNDRTEMKLTW
jgi:hypothetical protein